MVCRCPYYQWITALPPRRPTPGLWRRSHIILLFTYSQNYKINNLLTCSQFVGCVYFRQTKTCVDSVGLFSVVPAATCAGAVRLLLAAQQLPRPGGHRQKVTPGNVLFKVKFTLADKFSVGGACGCSVGTCSGAEASCVSACGAGSASLDIAGGVKGGAGDAEDNVGGSCDVKYVA